MDEPTTPFERHIIEFSPYLSSATRYGKGSRDITGEVNRLRDQLTNKVSTIVNNDSVVTEQREEIARLKGELADRDQRLMNEARVTEVARTALRRISEEGHEREADPWSILVARMALEAGDPE